MQQVAANSNQENLELAFSTAEKELGVTRLIDPEGKFRLLYNVQYYVWCVLVQLHSYCTKTESWYCLCCQLFTVLIIVVYEDTVLLVVLQLVNCCPRTYFLFYTLCTGGCDKSSVHHPVRMKV